MLSFVVTRIDPFPFSGGLYKYSAIIYIEGKYDYITGKKRM